jgi:Zn-finger nucleic acid-binding protein
MEESQVDSVAVQFCRSCKGLLLAHADLTAILEASWRAVPVEEAERQSLVRPEKADADREVFCPFCQKRMDKYGYLGLAVVTIDRCDKCTRVWLDADELPKMVLALAKTNYRLEESRRRVGEALDLGAAGVAGTSQAAVAEKLLFSRRIPVRSLLDLFLS